MISSNLSNVFNIPAYFTWVLTSFFYAFQMTLRVLPGIMMDDIVTKFNMDMCQFGLLAGFYYLGYAGFQIPVGLLLDKYNPRYVLAFCIGLCSTGLLCFSYFDNKIFAYIGRLLIGIGSVAGLLGSIKVIDELFPARYSIMLGFTVLIGITGAFYGGAPIAAMLNASSASNVINYLATTGLLLAVVIIVFYTRKPGIRNDGNIQFIDALKSCLKNKQLIYMGFFAGLMVGPVEGFADVWGVKYFIQVHNLLPNEASYATNLIFLGLGLGGPLLGVIANKGISEIKIIIFCGFAIVLCYLCLFMTTNSSIALIYLINFIIGLCSSYQVMVFSLVSRTNDKLVGLLSSALNMLIMSFGFVFHYCIGYTFELLFTPIIKDNISVYSPDAYHTAFSSVVIGVLIGTLGFARLERKIIK